MSLDELIKGINMFKQGISEYQTTQAVSDARKQLADVNANAKNEDERFQHAQAVGTDLALRMTAANVSPEKIQAAVGGLIPSASTMGQAAAMGKQEEAKMASMLPGSPAGLEKTKVEAAFALEKMKMDALMGRNSSKDLNEMTTKFEKMPETKPLLQAIPTLQDASDMMKKNYGLYGSTAVTNLVKMGVIKSAVQRVTEKEIAAANESPSAWANFKKNMGIELSGEAPKNVQDFWTRLVDEKLDNAKSQLKGHVKSYAGSNPKVDANVLEQTLLARHNLGAPKSTESADVQAALDWLASDEGSRADAGTLQAVRNKIKELRGKK